VASHCLGSIATTRLGVQLWKYLVLWLFGGVYVDLNYKPESFGLTTIDVNDDALLVVDSTDKNAFNTKFMAASPRHPLFFYAIRRILDDIVDGKPNISGDVVLKEAFEDFQKSKKGSSNEPVLLETGTFHGIRDRSIRVVSDVGRSGWVKQVAETDAEMNEEYQTMGWDLVREQDGAADA
ncbi:MAG: hypothetical protein SGARI_003865, partial [Bacillariaceae sp.]